MPAWLRHGVQTEGKAAQIGAACKKPTISNTLITLVALHHSTQHCHGLLLQLLYSRARYKRALGILAPDVLNILLRCGGLRAAGLSGQPSTEISTCASCRLCNAFLPNGLQAALNSSTLV
jgi:hypothetical protein